MKTWEELANNEIVDKTMAALGANGIDSVFVEKGKDAKEKALSLIPKNAEIMNMTSRTLETIGVAKEIEESGRYNAVRNKLYAMDRKTQSVEVQKLGAAPEYAIGSVHAVTQDGKVLIASNSGSQLPAYVYGSVHVIWIVGTQKIVKNLDEGMKRIYEYCLPFESERVQKAYGIPNSFVSKLLIINRENVPGRITLIFVNESLGF